MGPAGSDGTDGTDGINGIGGTDGKDILPMCLTCHSTANQDAKLAQYHLSKHFNGGHSSRNTKYCARCHTNEGAQEIMAMGTFVARNDIPHSTAIKCETCHEHTTFEFEGDTLTQILRTNTPVYLNYDKNLVATDFGKTNNLCTTCHQIRGITAESYIDDDGDEQDFDQLPFFPLDNTLEDSTVKYQVGRSFSVHAGNQSNLFAGINGYEYVGETYTRIWEHSANKCTDCHMNEYNATTATGGHTLIANEDKCLECHGGDKLSVVQTAISAKLEELQTELLAKGIFYTRVRPGREDSYRVINTHDFYGTLLPTTASTDTFALSFSRSTGVVSYEVDELWADRIGREWTYGELGAAYNFGFINSESSLGIHNPTYAMQLLQNSIDYLKAN